MVGRSTTGARWITRRTHRRSTTILAIAVEVVRQFFNGRDAIISPGLIVMLMNRSYLCGVRGLICNNRLITPISNHFRVQVCLPFRFFARQYINVRNPATCSIFAGRQEEMNKVWICRILIRYRNSFRFQVTIKLPYLQNNQDRYRTKQITRPREGALFTLRNNITSMRTKKAISRRVVLFTLCTRMGRIVSVIAQDMRRIRLTFGIPHGSRFVSQLTMRMDRRRYHLIHTFSTGPHYRTIRRLGMNVVTRHILTTWLRTIMRRIHVLLSQWDLPCLYRVILTHEKRSRYQ